MQSLVVLLEKLGIFNIFAVGFTGIIILYLAQIILVCMKIEILVNFESLNFDFSFMISISYFVGLIFQELGSIVFKSIVTRNNKLLMKVIAPRKETIFSITSIEKNAIYTHVKTKLCLSDDENQNIDDIIYHYCKRKLGSSQMIIEQVLSTMSRSLAVFFTMVALISVFMCFGRINYLYLGFISALLSFVLYFRSIRFAKMRYKNIYQGFYYEIVTTDQAKNTSITVKNVV